MKQFEVTMMCGACKWKITNELKKNGFDNFDIDLTTSLLTFKEDVNLYKVIRVVSDIGYRILEVPEDNSTNEE